MFKPIAIFATLTAALFTMTSALAQVEYGRRGDDRRYNDDRYGQTTGEQIRCESRNYNYTRCNVDWRNAQLIRQTSNNECRKGQSWGVDRNGLWVDRGCAGIFAEAGRRGRPGQGGGAWQPGNNWDRDIRFTCQSEDYRYKMCQVDTGRGGQVRIERQISDTRCVQNRNWGYNRAGVWVNGGCAAIFTVERRWR